MRSRRAGAAAGTARQPGCAPRSPRPAAAPPRCRGRPRSAAPSVPPRPRRRARCTRRSLRAAGSRRASAAPHCQPSRTSDGRGRTRTAVRRAPTSGQAAQHQDVGQGIPGDRRRLARDGVHERLVDHQDPARPPQREDVGRRVQHRRRVGGVTDDDEVGRFRHRRRIEPVRRVQSHVRDRDPRLAQGEFGFGERRVDQRGLTRPQSRQHREPLGAARQCQHLVRRTPVPGRDLLTRPPVGRLGGIPAQPGPRVGESAPQPLGRAVSLHVHREVEQSGSRLGVAVVPQARERVERRSRTEFHSRRAYGASRCAPPRTSDHNGWVTTTAAPSRQSAVRPRRHPHRLRTRHPQRLPARAGRGRCARPHRGNARDGHRTTADGFDARHGLDDAATAAALAAYFERYDAVGWSENQVYDGVEAMLAAAGATGRGCGRDVQDGEVRDPDSRALRLADYFEVIGGASSDGRGAPRPTSSDTSSAGWGCRRRRAAPPTSS